MPKITALQNAWDGKIGLREVREGEPIRFCKELCVIVFWALLRGFGWASKLEKMKMAWKKSMALWFLPKHLAYCCYQLQSGLIVGRAEVIRIINQTTHQ